MKIRKAISNQFQIWLESILSTITFTGVVEFYDDQDKVSVREVHKFLGITFYRYWGTFAFKSPRDGVDAFLEMMDQIGCSEEEIRIAKESVK